MAKMYFKKGAEDICYTLSHWKDYIAENKLNQIELLEAERETDTGYFFCKEYGEVGSVNEGCGKLCEKYKPNNGKNGRCRNYGYCYVPTTKLKIIKNKNMTKLYYRVSNKETQQGLWYDSKGNFTGMIHNEFSFCMNTNLQMPFDSDLVGWLSATDSLEDLFKWFSKEDIEKLENHGWFITVYEAEKVKQYKNHLVIFQETSKIKERIYLSDIGYTKNLSQLNDTEKLSIQRRKSKGTPLCE